MSNYHVNVYADEMSKDYENIIARVKYNSKLDYSNGSNLVNGGRGMHKGITKLRDGSYVIIIGSDHQGDKDYAYVVSKEEALREILNSGNVELLESKKFEELREMNSILENLEDLSEN